MKNIIDVSNMNGQDFVNTVLNSNGSIMTIIGESNNSILNLINQPENTPKFKIGDVVKMNHKILEFNGVKDNGKTYIILGVEKVNNQYLYICGDERFSFFGYELEKPF